MKDKLLQIRMSEEDVESLKDFTDKIGFKSVSDTVRESLKAFTVIKEREPKDADNMVKSCDASRILWSARFLCNGFDIQKYFSGDKSEIPKEYEEVPFNDMLVQMYSDGEFDSLKKVVLTSVYNDLVFSSEIDSNIDDLIKNIAVEYLKNK